MKTSYRTLNWCGAFIIMSIISMGVIESCKPCGEKTQLSSNQLSSSGQSEIQADLKVVRVNTGDYSFNVYIYEVDGCEYLVIGSNEIIHKANCKNPTHW